ncbi:MAG: phosphotriesterase [Bacteroidetes bacterium]|nr:MAG: phosphotriesterase [Bacteroidota bacterium]
MTVAGPLPAAAAGPALIHEHILVDFIGADSTGYHRWERDSVIPVVQPFLEAARAQGAQVLMECTPAYLGRDPRLLQTLSEQTGLHILTNTGYYGAVGNKYLPAHAYTETAAELAARWIAEWEEGIEDTGIKPGFIKISVEVDTLSDLHRKLVQAAAQTHLATGLTIASHTVFAVPAFEQLEVLTKAGVAPEAFIWVHAQGEPDRRTHLEAARQGAWISLDGLNPGNQGDYVVMLENLRAAGLLHRALLSHDAGWYTPGEAGGGDFRAYEPLYTTFLPRLRAAGFTEAEIEQLTVTNPAEAFAVRVRGL